MQKPNLEVISCKNSLVKILLNRAEGLAFQAVDGKYRVRLGRAQQVITNFCNWTGEVVCPASINTIRAFLGWLELVGLAMQVQEYLGAIARLHKEKGFDNPVQDLRVKEVVRGMRLIGVKEKEVDWLWDPFPLEALRNYYDNSPRNVDPIIWCRDLALVALVSIQCIDPESCVSLS